MITRIKDNRIVLPVIQRRLVWDEEKMETLFDSLFRQNSFGSIICIEEMKGKKPLFAYRLFTVDGSNTVSFEVNNAGDTMLVVIDGQQRLQSFYMGLCGRYNDKILYYDLFSNYKVREYNFKFSSSLEDLPKRNRDNALSGKYLWYPAPYLFSQLQDMEDTRRVAENITSEKGIKDLEQARCIENNIWDFYGRIFGDKSVGLSKVIAHMSGDIIDDRQRIAEMFRRLNSSGTRLSQYDLVASSLKSFDYRMEKFLDDVISKNSDMGIDQDVLIKMLLVLNDKPNKGMTDMTAEDAEFATGNLERIQATLEALRIFLKASNNEEWFASINRSAIPLYFLAYHIFYQSKNPEELRNMFIQFDTKDKNFRNMSLWLKLSLLNQVFRRGCGWIPEKNMYFI